MGCEIRFTSFTTRTSRTYWQPPPPRQLCSQIVSVSNELRDFTSCTTRASRTTWQGPLSTTLLSISKWMSLIRCGLTIVTMWYLILSHWNISHSPLTVPIVPIAWIQRLISPLYTTRKSWITHSTTFTSWTSGENLDNRLILIPLRFFFHTLVQRSVKIKYRMCEQGREV